MCNTGFLKLARLIPASLSTVRAEELTTALAAGYWWAVMEVLHPIDEEPEYDYSSVLVNELMEAPDASWPSAPGAPGPASLEMAPEKAESSHSSRKNTKQYMGKSQKTHEVPWSARSELRDYTTHVPPKVQSSRNGAPIPEKDPERAKQNIPNALTQEQQKNPLNSSPQRGLNSLPITEASDSKSAPSKLVDFTPPEVRSSKDKPAPSGSPMEPSMVAMPPKRKRLPIPHYMAQDFFKALGMPVPALPSKVQAQPAKSSERAPAFPPKVQASPNEAPIPEKDPESAKQNTPKALTQEQQKQNPLNSSPQRGLNSLPIAEASDSKSAPSKLVDFTSPEVRSQKDKPVPSGSPMEPSKAAEPPKRRRLTIPHHLAQDFFKADTGLGIPVPTLPWKVQAQPAKSSERAPAFPPKVQASPNEAPVPEKDPERAKQNIPKVLTHEQQKHNPLNSSPQRCLNSLPIAEASDSKSAPSKLVDFTSPEVRSPKDNPVPSGSPMEPSKAAEPPKRRRLTIPHHLARDFFKADTDLGIPVPAYPSKVQAQPAKSSERAPALPPKVQASPNEVAIPEKDPERAKPNIPNALTQEQQKQNPLNSSPQRGLNSLPITEASDNGGVHQHHSKYVPSKFRCQKDKSVPFGSHMEPSMAARPSKRGRLIIPHYLTGHLHKAATSLGMPVPVLPLKVNATGPQRTF